ncbi:MAG: toxin-antitoxin system HicB family antitoxin [Planctomycetaceae bacterium]|jgi:predicted HicB family RNase H-like nuclease|nr:toxin-antitoxin system HicB family antitoxin [Planctomycetaceae bacterium]
MTTEGTTPAVANPMPFETRCHRVLQFARDLYRQSPDWVKFFREVVGVDGAARKVFTTQDEFIAFERSDAFHTIKRMVNALRNNKSTSHSEEEETRVITVRLPESVHEALKAEAEDHGTSMNKLCISKLLQVLDEDEAAQRARSANRLGPKIEPQPASRSLTSPAYSGASNVSPVSPFVQESPAVSVGQPVQAVTPPYRPNFS